VRMRRELFAIFVNMFFISLSLAQLSIDTYTASIGRIRTTYSGESFYSDYQYAFYPELQIGGRFIVPHFTWAVYWGYWTDGITKPFPVADMPTYSNHTNILGMRIGFLPAGSIPNRPLQIQLFGGVSHHFISQHWIGGFGLAGDGGYDYKENMNTLDIGLSATFPIFGQFRMKGEFQQYFPISGEEYIRHHKQQAYKVGFIFQL
jgi:hypothetical protein